MLVDVVFNGVVDCCVLVGFKITFSNITQYQWIRWTCFGGNLTSKTATEVNYTELRDEMLREFSEKCDLQPPSVRYSWLNMV